MMAIKMRYEWVFVSAVGVVAVCLALVWRADESAAGAALAVSAPATVGAVSAADGVPADPGAATASLTAPATAPAMASATSVPPIGSDTERAQTRDQRLAALPVFLAAANQGIATLQAELQQAQARGADAAEIAAMTARLEHMQQVRGQVLARNDDIVN